MAGADSFDQAPIHQGEQEKRAASLSARHHVADSPAAAVVFPECPGVYAAKRSGPKAVGRGPDRGAQHAPLCWYRADQRPDPR